MKLSQSISLWISVLFSVLALVLLVFVLDVESLNPAEYSIQWSFFGVSSGLFLANYLFRSARFREFLKGEIRYKILFSISLVHGALNYFFPVKAGELSFPLLSKVFLGRALLESGVALIVCRVLDLILVLVLFALVLLFLDSGKELFTNFGFNEIGVWWFFLAMVLVLGGALFFINKKFDMYKRLLMQISYVLDGGGPMIARLAVSTVIIWFCILGNFYFLVLCLGYQVPLTAVVVISVIMTPLSMIPLQGVANIGIFELGWVSGLVLFGFSNNESLEIAVKVHVMLTVQVVFILVLGAFLLVMGRLVDRYA